MKQIFLLFLLSFSLFSCKKNNDDPQILPEILNTYSVDTTVVYPSSTLIVTSNNKLTIDSATILVGGQPTLLAKLDTFRYVFILPIVPSGKYKIDLSKVKGSNAPEISVGTYTTITNPTTVLNNFSTQFKSCLDTLLNTKYKNLISSSDSLFLRQALLQFNKNLLSLTDAQKLRMAYLINQLDFTPLNAKGGSNIDTNYMTFSNPSIPSLGQLGKISFGINSGGVNFDHSIVPYDPLDPEIGEKMFNKAKETANKVGIAVASIYPVIGFGVLAYLQPETIPLFIAAIVNYKYRMHIAAECLGETVNMASVAEDVETDNTTTPLILTKALNALQRIRGKYRTPNQADANNSYYGSIVQNDNQLVETDGIAKSKFDGIKNLLSSWFDLFSQSYNAYSVQVKNTVTEKLQQVNNKFVTISNISNPDIVLTASDGGVNGLQIVATNPSNNITTSTNFTFNENYTQSAINNSVSAVQQATYIPVTPIVLTTIAISNVTTTSAVTGGTITNDGGSAITTRGICWATTPSPTINNFKNTYGSGTGTYSGICTNLTANTTYYVRAYATNSNGTFYGNEISFATSQIQLPTITTTALSNITLTSATSGGNITNDGGSSVIVRGVCWSTTQNPTITNNKTTDGTGTGAFISNMAGLIANTTYYVRAYATNNLGTTYGNQISFLTHDPSINPYGVTLIGSTSASGSGKFYYGYYSANDLRKISFKLTGSLSVSIGVAPPPYPGGLISSSIAIMKVSDTLTSISYMNQPNQNIYIAAGGGPYNAPNLIITQDTLYSFDPTSNMCNCWKDQQFTCGINCSSKDGGYTYVGEVTLAWIDWDYINISANGLQYLKFPITLKRQ